VSIVRVGLAETRRFAEGYEAIFGKKTETAMAKSVAPVRNKKKKPAKKARKR
jgi:hypothetical protein